MPPNYFHSKQLGKFYIKTKLQISAEGTIYLIETRNQKKKYVYKKYSKSRFLKNELFIRDKLKGCDMVKMIDYELDPNITDKVYTQSNHTITPYYGWGDLQTYSGKISHYNSQKYFNAVCAALDPLWGSLQQYHERGVCHFDVKPENILVDNNGKGVFHDFGHSIADFNKRRISPNILYGAPENHRFDPYTYKAIRKNNNFFPLIEDYDTRADVWALGLVYISMYLGEHMLFQDHGANLRERGLPYLVHEFYGDLQKIPPHIRKILEASVVPNHHDRASAAEIVKLKDDCTC